MTNMKIKNFIILLIFLTIGATATYYVRLYLNEYLEYYVGFLFIISPALVELLELDKLFMMPLGPGGIDLNNPASNPGSRHNSPGTGLNNSVPNLGSRPNTSSGSRPNIGSRYRPIIPWVSPNGSANSIRPIGPAPLVGSVNPVRPFNPVALPAQVNPVGIAGYVAPVANIGLDLRDFQFVNNNYYAPGYNPNSTISTVRIGQNTVYFSDVEARYHSVHAGGPYAIPPLNVDEVMRCCRRPDIFVSDQEWRIWLMNDATQIQYPYNHPSAFQRWSRLEYDLRVPLYVNHPRTSELVDYRTVYVFNRREWRFHPMRVI